MKRASESKIETRELRESKQDVRRQKKKFTFWTERYLERLTCAPQLTKQTSLIPLTTSQNVFAPNLWQQEEAKHKNVAVFAQLSQ
jgi:hypothetical protein